MSNQTASKEARPPSYDDIANTSKDNNNNNNTTQGNKNRHANDNDTSDKIIDAALSVTTNNDAEFSKKLSKHRKRGMILINTVFGIILIGIFIFCLMYLTNEYSFIISYIFFSFEMLLVFSIVYWHYIKEKLLTSLSTTNKSFDYFDTFRLIKDKYSIIGPCATHFADIASDIAVLIEFYQSGEDTLAFVTICILLLHRLLSSLVIYDFSKSLFDAFLQLFDLYIYKLIRINIETKSKKESLVQKYIQYLEALFESAPQLLVTLNVTIQQWAIENKSVSWVVYISSIFSFLSLVKTCIGEDKLLIAKQWRELKLDARNCPKIKLNYLYLIRSIYRLIDVSIYFLYLSLFWILTNGQSLTVLLAIALIMLLSVQFYKCYIIGLSRFDVYFCNILLKTPFLNHNNDQNIAYATIRYFVMVFSYFYIINYASAETGRDEYPKLDALMTIFEVGAILFPFLSIAMSKSGIIADNDAKTNTAARSLQGCHDIDTLQELLKYGYKVTMIDIYDATTWSNFEDSLVLLDWLISNENEKITTAMKDENIEKFANVWHGIFMNPRLSEQNANYWIELFDKGNLTKYVNVGFDKSGYTIDNSNNNNNMNNDIQSFDDLNISFKDCMTCTSLHWPYYFCAQYQSLSLNKYVYTNYNAKVRHDIVDNLQSMQKWGKCKNTLKNGPGDCNPCVCIVWMFIVIGLCILQIFSICLELCFTSSTTRTHDDDNNLNAKPKTKDQMLQEKILYFEKLVNNPRKNAAMDRVGSLSN